MLTSKQRAGLRKLAHDAQSVTQIGKGGITDAVLESLDKTLQTRELIKVTVLETAMLDTKEAMNFVAEKLGAEAVFSAGFKFVIYRKSEKDPQIKLCK